MQNLSYVDAQCGFADFRNKYLTFPPSKFPKDPPSGKGQCNLWDKIYQAVLKINPCFDIYHITESCPIGFDPLGFPGSFPYMWYDDGGPLFNQTKFKKLINAPMNSNWMECSPGVLTTDTSPPSGVSVLPKVIDRVPRTIIAHGDLDYILIPNGTLLMIQNMTWRGQQGFRNAPTEPFIVPPHPDLGVPFLAGSGRYGTTHTERGVTWVETWMAGHMIPEHAPAAAYRQLQYLLGRIPSING